MTALNQVKQHNSEQAVIRVTPIGFDAKGELALQTVFNNSAKHCATIASEQTAQAGIIDLSNADAELAWKRFRKSHQQMPAIVLGAPAQLRDDNCINLSKPLKVNQLVSALEELSSRFGSTPATPTAESANPAPQKAKAARSSQAENAKAEEPDNGFGKLEFYDKSQYIQDKLEQAIAKAISKKQIIKLHITLDSELYHLSIFPSHRKVITDMNREKLRCLLSAPSYCYEIRQQQMSGTVMEPQMLTTEMCLNFETLLWEAAVAAANGRLPQNTDPNQAISLKHWPNITRLRIRRDTMAICAMLFSRPLSLTMLVRILGVKRRSAIDFYVGTQALGLIEQTQSAEKNATDTGEHSKRGMFSKIVGKLTGQ